MVRGQVPVQERVLDFRAADGDAGWGRGSQNPLWLGGGWGGSRAWLLVFIGPGGWAGLHQGPQPQSPATPAAPPDFVGNEPHACMGSWEAGGCLALPLSPRPYSALGWSLQELPDYTAGCPRPPEAHSPPPAAWLCQELTGAASKHPWAPAQASALAIGALPQALQRRRGGGGWRRASREEAPTWPAGCRSRWGNGHGGATLLPAEASGPPDVSHLPRFSLQLLVSQECGVSAGSTPSLPCMSPTSQFLGLSQQGFQRGAEGGKGTRSQGKWEAEGRQEGRRQFNFQSWSWQYR